MRERLLRLVASGLVFTSLLSILACLSGAAPSTAASSILRHNATTLRPAPRASYPLRVGPNRRYLVDRRGRPFLIVGDSPQALVVDVSLPDADRFLADRSAKGFNTVWINLLCNTYTGGRADGTTSDKIAPFTTPGDLATPNEAYFRRADAMIRLARKYGSKCLSRPDRDRRLAGYLLENGDEEGLRLR